MKIAPIALAFATASALAGTPETPEITGKVVDAASGRAIPGAVVVAKMGGDGGSMFGHGHFRQLHCTAVRADEQGRFRIPAWTWSGRRSMSLDGYGAHFSAYHPDYTIYTPGGPSGLHHPIRSIPLIGTQLKPSEAVVRMHRFAKDSGNAWYFKLGLPIDDFGCDWDADIANTDLVWEAMREEVEAFDAQNPKTPMLWKLRLNTKRPQPPPPAGEHRSIGIRSPTDRGSSVPARVPK